MVDPATSTAGASNRLEFETLIADTSASLMAAAPAFVESAVQAALYHVRIFFEADRCAIVDVSPNLQRANVSQAAYADGVSQVSTEVNLTELFPWSRQKLLEEGLPVAVHRMSDLPAEAARDRHTWEHFVPTRSSLTVPVFAEAQITHLVVIQWAHLEHQVADVYVPRLRLLAELLINALARRRAHEELLAWKERLDRAAAAANCGLWELDIPSGHVWVTSETRRLYGLTLDEPVDRGRFLAVVHPDDRQRVAAAIDAAMRDEATFDQQYHIVRDDGSVRCLRATGRASGPTRLVGASVDVTDHEAAEALERHQAARLAAAIETAGLGFSDLTVGGSRPFIDSRLADMLGVTVEDPRAYEAWLSRIHPEDRPVLLAERQRLQAGEIEHATLEYRYEHPSRGQIWLRHSSGRMKEAPGRQATGIRLIAAVQDITQLRRREEELRSTLEEVRRLRDRLQQENVHLRRLTGGESVPALITGRSPAIRNALALAEHVAPTMSTVLLLGETGTGKERFAEVIHRASPRGGNPMVRVNCSAIPSALIESELFGREKGAYTGALSKQIGRFEMAHESTLFLDEVGDLPLEVQVKLLRMLQERAFERLGSPRSISVDVRIVAATNRNLEQAVQEGRVRADLYYRLNVFPIVIPPLRARPEDIPGLVTTLLDELARAMGKRFDGVSKASMDGLMGYGWPGNIRELRNVLERAMILSPGPMLEVTPPASSSTASTAVTTATSSRELHDVEREHILRVLEEAGWRIRGARGAAAVLGLKPTTLEARMARLDIRRPSSGRDT